MKHDVITMRPTITVSLAGALAAYAAACAGSNQITFEDAAHQLAAYVNKPKAMKPAKVATAGDRLSAALKRVITVMERRNSIPILSMVRLTASAGRLRLAATDLDMEFTTDIEGFHGPDFETCCDPWALSGMVKGGDGVEFIPPGDDPRLGVKVGVSVARLPVLPVGDFPVMVAKGGSMCAIGAAELRDALAFVRPYVSAEETRYYLNGLYVQPILVEGRDLLRFVATDGHRCALQTMDAPAWDGPEPVGVIIPRKTVDVILKALPEAGDVLLELSREKIRITLPDGVLTSKLIDGSYPDIDRVIPRDESKARIIVEDDKAFRAEVSRLAAISSEKSRSMRLTIAGEVEAVVRNMEAGQVVGLLPATAEGEPTEASFNAIYLRDAVSAPAVIHVSGPNDPVRFDFPGRPDRLAVVMTLRT